MSETKIKIGFSERELATLDRLDSKFWEGVDTYTETLEDTSDFTDYFERLLAIAKRVDKRSKRELRRIVKQQQKICEALLAGIKDAVGTGDLYVDGFYNGVVSVIDALKVLGMYGKAPQ